MKKEHRKTVIKRMVYSLYLTEEQMDRMEKDGSGKITTQENRDIGRQMREDFGEIVSELIDDKDGWAL